jgi:hypothetical protein
MIFSALQGMPSLVAICPHDLPALSVDIRGFSLCFFPAWP